MKIVETVLVVLSALCQMGGVVLVVRAVFAAKKQLDTPIERFIDGGQAGSAGATPPRAGGDSTEVFLLQSMERQGLAVVLLVIGTLTGMAAGLAGIWASQTGA